MEVKLNWGSRRHVRGPLLNPYVELQKCIDNICVNLQRSGSLLTELTISTILSNNQMKITLVLHYNDFFEYSGQKLSILRLSLFNYEVFSIFMAY